MVNVTCLLAEAGSGVGLSFGVRALTEMEIRCVKGMFRLKLISSGKNSVFKGLKDRVRVSYRARVMVRVGVRVGVGLELELGLGLELELELGLG